MIALWLCNPCAVQRAKLRTVCPDGVAFAPFPRWIRLGTLHAHCVATIGPAYEYFNQTAPPPVNVEPFQLGVYPYRITRSAGDPWNTCGHCCAAIEQTRA